MSVELALTVFFLSVPLFLVFLPFFVEGSGRVFSRVELVHLVIKRGCWVLASWFMTLVSGVMLGFAQNAGYFLSGEVSLYLWFFGMGGYLLMMWIGFVTVRDAFLMHSTKKERERYGE